MPESTLHDEALDLIAGSRELLSELLEEGVDAIEAADYTPAPAATSPADAPAPAAPPAPVSAAASAATAAPAPATARHVPPAASVAEAPPVETTTAAPSWGATATLEDVQRELGDCRRCVLCERRRNIVFGSGNPSADLMFIGEGPGEQEDIQGLPFVGRAGELLTSMIEKGIEIPRQDVYICNIVKCRPPGNRNPQPQEVAACRPFLDGQIAAVNPKVIVSLGKPAASLLLGRDVAITRERGQWREYRGIPLMPTLHPAFVLRQYTPENRRLVWEDLKQAVARMRGE